jgi:mevalonate kinase
MQLSNSQMNALKKALSECHGKKEATGFTMQTEMTKAQFANTQMFEFSDFLILYTVNGSSHTPSGLFVSNVFVLANTKELTKEALASYHEMSEKSILAIRAQDTATTSKLRNEMQDLRIQIASEWLDKINKLINR